MSEEQLNDVFVDFQCPYCGSPLSFLEAKLGTAQECPHCSETVVVPPSGSGIDARLPVPIETARLILRPLREGDVTDWLKFITDEDSYKYLDHYAPNAEAEQSWFERSRASRLTQANGYLVLGFELKENAKLIGHLPLCLNDPEEHRQGGFEIIVHPAYRCKGYGTEALVGLLGFGFGGIGLHDIRARIDIRNLAGRRMAEKAGLKLEGEFHEERRIKGEWSSGAYYSILSKWWQQAVTV